MVHKFKAIYILILGISLLLVGNVYAKHFSITEVINNLFMDTVDISLEEYMELENGELVLFKPAEILIPGDTISYVSQINNLGVDCYIRLKVSFSNLYKDGIENNELDPLDMTHIKNIDESQWVYRNGYLYYVDVLKEGETVLLPQKINTPVEWNNSYAKHQFDVDITAEAIQSKNFEVDITSENPWGSIQPQKTIRSRLFNE